MPRPGGAPAPGGVTTITAPGAAPLRPGRPDRRPPGPGGPRAALFLAPEAVDDATADLAAARDHLESVAAGLRSRGHVVQVAVERGPAAATIVDVAREQAVDAIALATHGRGGLARLVMGSVAYETARRAAVPLLLVRPAALR